MGSNKKKILIFVDWYIPAFKAGGPIQSVYNLVSRFSDEYDFYIITGDRDLGDKHPYENIKLDEWVSVENSKVIYLSKAQQDSGRFKTLIKEIDPEIIYLNSLFSFTFSLRILWLKKKFPLIKFILAPRGMLGKGSLELKRRKKEIFLSLARIIKLYKGIYWHVTNEKEKNEVEKAFGKQSYILIADNIARTPKFSLKEVIDIKLDVFETKRFLFVGRISKVKNVDLLIKWFNNLSNNNPNYKLDIIGNIEDQKYYQELLSLISSNSKISIHGAIHPNDLAKIYAEAHFFCLPTKHENYGHAIIEALSYACPVIISDNTPWRSLSEKNVGWDISLNDADGFKKVISKCIDMDEKTYLSMSSSSYEFAQEHISQSEVLDAYRKLLT